MLVGRARYFVILVDDLTKKMWVFVMKYIGKWLEKFLEFNATIETQLKHENKVF